jgi:hypothetical protein
MREEDVLPAPQQQRAESCRLVGGADLRAVNFIAGLQDAWLLQHPHQLQPTHYTWRHGGNSSSSLEQQESSISGGRIYFFFFFFFLEVISYNGLDHATENSLHKKIR